MKSSQPEALLDLKISINPAADGRCFSWFYIIFLFSTENTTLEFRKMSIVASTQETSRKSIAFLFRDKKVDGSTSEGALLPGKEMDSMSVGKVPFHVC